MTYTSPIRLLSLSLLLFWLSFTPGCVEPEAPPTRQQQKQRTLALVSLSDSEVTVKNLDSATLPDVILLINVRRPGETVVQAGVGDIAPGKTVNVSYADFTDVDGKRFDASKTRIYTVAIKTPVETNADGYKTFLCSTNICQPASE
ncbi:MAG TPA: hypothetical protein VF544_03220 [Pyrinomonadaceae bacterium]|jgi:hypothetical protein